MSPAATATAGIIANPQSGKDIRRLVAHASVFSNDEKVAIVRRIVMGMLEAGVDRILYMPDPYRLIAQAVDGLRIDGERVQNRVQPLAGTYRGGVDDTTAAATLMSEAGVSVAVSLGGDGTNRAIVKGSRTLPLIPVSTGTNNVFPRMVEGTVVGLAAAAVATGLAPLEAVSQRAKLIEIEIESRPPDLALIDAVVLNGAFIGSRAVWEIDIVREAIMTRAAPDSIGFSAIGGMLQTVTPADDAGFHIRLARDDGAPAQHQIRAAIAPGLVRAVAIASADRLDLGAIVRVDGPAMIALDGEREFHLREGQSAALRVTRDGPPVVAIDRCLQLARDAGFLSSPLQTERSAGV